MEPLFCKILNFFLCQALDVVFCSSLIVYSKLASPRIFIILIPVYVRRDDRIKAHFMTCCISLLLYRLLEKKIGNSYTSEQIIEILRSMKMTLLNTANGYVPSYTRTEITDSLHKTFGFRTDYEFIKKSTIRSIIKQKK